MNHIDHLLAEDCQRMTGEIHRHGRFSRSRLTIFPPGYKFTPLKDPACPYCRKVYASHEDRCTSCGAPRTSQT